MYLCIASSDSARSTIHALPSKVGPLLDAIAVDDPRARRYRDRVALDSVGGTALLVDAALHRAGIVFPETPYRFLIETEGFGAVLRDHGIEMVGLPNVEVIHADA